MRTSQSWGWLEKKHAIKKFREAVNSSVEICSETATKGQGDTLIQRSGAAHPQNADTPPARVRLLVIPPSSAVRGDQSQIGRAERQSGRRPGMPRVQRETLVELVVLCAVAREHVRVIGPPSAVN
jgi:hypothetical protein